MKYFTVVSRLKYPNPEKQEEWKCFFPAIDASPSFSVRLIDTPDSLGEALKALKALENKDQENGDSACSLIINSPTSVNHTTVSIWQFKKKLDNTYYVKYREDLLFFNKLEPSNLLYLPSLKGKTLVEFRNMADGGNFRYQVIELTELGFPNSLASKKNELSGALFKQVPSYVGSGPTIINLEVAPNTAADPKNDFHEEGWLNPVIFTLAINKNDLEQIYKAEKNTHLHSLSLFIDKEAIILVEPHIDDTHDLRISFLMQFYENIKQRPRYNPDNESLNLLEQIWFGSKHPQPWKPFLILDLLGGEFYAHQNVVYPKPQELSISWKLPENATFNKKWLAEYWLDKWVGTQKIDNLETIKVVNPPSPARLYSSSKGLITFSVENTSTISLVSLLSSHPWYSSNSFACDPYQFIVKLFQQPELEPILNKFPHHRFWRWENLENKLIKFDDVEFWEFFSKNYVTPKSPLLIAIPNETNKFLEPVNSVNRGAYHFIYSLFNHFNDERKDDMITIYNHFGWWNDWHSTIFKERWDIQLRFITGFVLEESLLGVDYLGEETDRVEWKEPNMGFSRS